jgi:hypothetical protein
MLKGGTPAGWVRGHGEVRGHHPKYSIRSQDNPCVNRDGVESSGRLASRLVTIKTGSRKQRRAFEHFCRVHGVDFHVPENEWVREEDYPPPVLGHATVYVVTGQPLAIHMLERSSFIVEDSGVNNLSVRAPRFNSSTYYRVHGSF